MVEAGMPVMDADRSATIVPAKYLEVDDGLAASRPARSPTSSRCWATARRRHVLDTSASS